MDKRRRKVIRFVCDPRTRHRAIRRCQPIALEILQRSADVQPQRVPELAKLPRFAAAGTPGHQCVAPVQPAARIQREIELLDERGAGERNHRIPMAVQLGVFGDLILMADDGNLAGWAFNLPFLQSCHSEILQCARGMSLKCRLRGQDHARAALDADQWRSVSPANTPGPAQTTITYAASSIANDWPIRNGGSMYAWARIVRPRRRSKTSSRRAARPISDAARESGNRV